ncbi:MAG: glutamate synthase central domain-containing protein, partial [Actinomycetota bacterium]
MAPGAQGLYDPSFEHDACGVSFVADLHGRRSNDIVVKGLTALTCLQHRGATNAEPNTGDGAGILIQVPHEFLTEVVDGLPDEGAYATGIAFLPADAGRRDADMAAIETIAAEEGLRTVAWRDVPVDPEGLGEQALAVMPSFRQLFLAADPAAGDVLTGLDLDRRVYVARKRFEHELADVYFPSLSSRTLVYKGMLTTPQLSSFFPDLRDGRLTSALALVHSRFSTNTFPSWPLAHPYRFVAHNGEINTVMGNRNWMRAREAMLAADHWPEPDKLFPICTPGASDTASFDEALELLHLGGYPIHHAVLMMIPEAWEKNPDLPQDQRDFYRFYGSSMEPWDGPASVTFTDGAMVGAVLDRNGLRPSRYWVTADGLVVMASEVGVLDIDPADVVHKGRLEPGKMFLVDTDEGRIVDDAEIMASLAAERPYGAWLERLKSVDELPASAYRHPTRIDPEELTPEQSTNGYTIEELDLLVDPMAETGKEAIGSMGTDTPVAVLSDRPRMLFDYFSQLFAQVTNPPLDAIREELVTSHQVVLGPSANILDPKPNWCDQLVLDYPVITPEILSRITTAGDHQYPQFKSEVLHGLYPVAEGAEGLEAALDKLCSQARTAINHGATILILSTRGATADLAPIPSLLLTGAVHHFLTREKLRTHAGLIVEAADAREVHHFALLLGCGASAVCPSLLFETLTSRLPDAAPAERRQAEQNYVKAASNGVIKVMSKMGISTVASYTGAQIFEAIGLSQELVDRYFTGITSKLGGIGLTELAEECARRHRVAYPDRPELLAHRQLDAGGEYKWRREGEYHLFNPETVFKLQHATRTKRYDIFKEYTTLVDSQAERLATLRGLFRFRSEREPIPVEEVEPISEIVKRFATGAMSYGSISAEAHETLAIAMNRLGGKSNTGEGGEDPERFVTMPNGDSKRSSIKQVASGRFGVTSEYLTES